MKWFQLVLIPITVLALFLAGCAGAPEPAAEVSVDTDVAEAVKEEPEAKAVEKKEPITVTETIYLVEEEISYYGDGMVDQRRLTTYRDDSTEKVESVLYDAEGEIEESSSYVYENGLLLEEVNRDKAGEILSIHRYTYSNGLLTEDLLLDRKEEPQTKQVWMYDDGGRKVKWEIHGGNGALLAYTGYIYQGDKLDRIENYNPAGDLEELFLHEYDGDLLVKKSELDGKENLAAYTTYRYDGGYLIEETLHRKSGAVRRKTLYENDENGNPVNILYVDVAGNVLEKLGRSYVSRTVTRTVAE